MIVDGRAIATRLKEKLREEVKALATPPTLALIVVGTSAPTETFIALKKKVAEEMGVAILERRFASDVSEAVLLGSIASCVRESDGIIVQLPLPRGINADRILDSVPVSHDVDVLGSTSREEFKRKRHVILPPVVGAIEEILRINHIAVRGKRALVIGRGRNVGVPAALWLQYEGAFVKTLGGKTWDLASYTKEADIIVLGAGSPGLLTPKMINEGLIILDAGTSEEAGKLAGDADPACAKKASLFTPVPGGIGPITVAKIFENLLKLEKAKYA